MYYTIHDVDFNLWLEPSKKRNTVLPLGQLSFIIIYKHISANIPLLTKQTISIKMESDQIKAIKSKAEQKNAAVTEVINP